MNVEMGATYWKIDGTVNTFDTLKSQLESFGLIAINQRPLGDEFGFKRVIDWETPTGLHFSTIWHINICNIRFGNEFENDFGEITFEGIQGSYLPYCDHNTIDFVYKGNTMYRLALKRNEV